MFPIVMKPPGFLNQKSLKMASILEAANRKPFKAEVTPPLHAIGNAQIAAKGGILGPLRGRPEGGEFAAVYEAIISPAGACRKSVKPGGVIPVAIIVPTACGFELFSNIT